MVCRCMPPMGILTPYPWAMNAQSRVLSLLSSNLSRTLSQRRSARPAAGGSHMEIYLQQHKKGNYTTRVTLSRCLQNMYTYKYYNYMQATTNQSDNKSLPQLVDDVQLGYLTMFQASFVYYIYTRTLPFLSGPR